MHPTLIIFLDGVGIGKADAESNPFFKFNFRFLRDIFGDVPHLKNQYLSNNGTYLFPVDACMGLPGLPQSGTGQTSIFCGINAPEIIGKHFGPYPFSTLIPIIKEKNIFKEFLNRGMKPAFANAYPKIFFDYINSGRTRLSVTSLSCLLSGVRLNKATDLRKGHALSAEIDNIRWIEKLNYKLPVIKPVTAAKRLMRINSQHQFTLFEFFFTDHIGHGRNPEYAQHTLKVLDEFLFYILSNLDANTTLLICSDHGNLEDMSIKMHTRNPALTITAGKNANKLAANIKSLYDIKRSILEMYE